MDVNEDVVPDFLQRITDIGAAVGLNKRDPTEVEETVPMLSEAETWTTQKIPTSVEEFMTMERIREWPSRITSEYPIEHDPSSLIGDENQIKESLQSAAPLEEQLSALDALQERNSDIQEMLKRYTDHILTDEVRFSRIKNNFFYSNCDKLFLTETPDGTLSHTQRESLSKDKMVKELQEKKKHDVNFTEFPGYKRRELPELPNQLEAPQIMHRVTKIQKFNERINMAGFSRFWKKIFLSEASVAVVHDLFWWCFLKMFKRKTEKERNKLFDRLADSFSALFFSVNSDIQDKIFKVYPDVLAQTIYVIFHDSFPESHRMFGPLFMEEIVGFCWELTTGTKTQPGSWKNWDMDSLQGNTLLDSKGNPIDPSKKESDSIKLDSANLDYDFTGLYNSINTLECDSSGQLLEKTQETVIKPKLKSKPGTESSYPGPGLEFQKVLFNISGQSPLIAHFLHMRHLRDVRNEGRKVKRTEIKGEEFGEETFRDIVEKKKQLTKVNKAKYTKVCDETEEEVNRIERKSRQVSREIEKIKDNLAVYKQNGYDIKFITDRMIAKINNRKPYIAMNLASNIGQPSMDRESDSDGIDEEMEWKIAKDMKVGGRQPDTPQVTTVLRDKKFQRTSATHQQQVIEEGLEQARRDAQKLDEEAILHELIEEKLERYS